MIFFISFFSIKKVLRKTKNSKKSQKNPKNRYKVQKKVLKFENKTNIRVDKVKKGGIMKSQKQMFVICSEVDFMSIASLYEILFFCALVMVGSCAILNEEKIAKFERKLAKYVKAFFKAVYLTVKEKKQTNKTVVVTEYKNPEYDEMLARLNKASKVENVLVA